MIPIFQRKESLLVFFKRYNCLHKLFLKYSSVIYQVRTCLITILCFTVRRSMLASDLSRAYVCGAHVSHLILGFAAPNSWAAASKPGENVIFCECAPGIYFGVNSLWFKYLCVSIALEIFPQLPRHSPNTFWISQRSGVFADSGSSSPYDPFPAAQLSGPKRKEHLMVWKI